MVFSTCSRRGYEPFDQNLFIYQFLTKITICVLSFSLCMIILLYVSANCCNSNTLANEFHDPLFEKPLLLNHGKLKYIKDENDVDKFHSSGERKSGQECTISFDDEKFDCYPEDGGSEELCKKRGCCWQATNNKSVDFPPLNVPWCFYPKSYGGYEYINVSYSTNGVRAFMKRSFASPYPYDVQILRLDFHYESSSRLHLKIIDAVNDRYQSPLPEVPMAPSNPPRTPNYKVLINESESGFKIVRDDSSILFDALNKGGFIFANQFLQISAEFSGKIYGLGEHESSLQLNTSWNRFTMFNHDSIPVPNLNLYGSHPFYLVLEPTGKSHGVYFLNSNAMDVLLQPKPAITFRAIGGIFDFYFFTGPTPGDVIRQYTEVIGRPFLPPYWSLGFHLSRYGYKNVEDMRRVWERTRNAEIPFDTQWNDIDYMDSNNDFTVDEKRYGNLSNFVKELHNAGMHFVPILDPGVSGCEPRGSYPPYDLGVQLNAFVNDVDGKPFVGKVWNKNCTVFPDFTNPDTGNYWTTMIKKFHDSVAFDGLWIDMNEPSNFLDGTVNGCPNNSLEHPPYVPAVDGGKLFYKTICMSAKQYAGLHYDVHNLYGISEAIATDRALKEITQKRPFIISRSTFPGIGRFAGHWSGDVVSTWHDMEMSVPQMLAFSLFGIPMMGADICGFNGNTTVNLCQRWSQLGAFYPFSRNHNTDDAFDQDPVALGNDTVQGVKTALQVRYSLLPYLYTLFWKAHYYGDTVARPLFFEFPEDVKTHDFDKSFLWGCCILIVPVLKEHALIVKTYLPKQIWYDWYTGFGLMTNGTEVDLQAPSDHIPVLIRGGSVIPLQEPNVTTTLSRLNKFHIVAAFSNNLSIPGSGSLYWDDGESLYNENYEEYGLVEFQLTAVNLTSQVKHWKTPLVPKLGSIKILGFMKPINKVTFNGKKCEFTYNATALVLTVDQLNEDLNKSFVLSWSI